MKQTPTPPPTLQDCYELAGLSQRTSARHYKGTTYNPAIASATAILCGKCANDNSKGIIQDIAENGLSDRLVNAIADTHKASKQDVKDVLWLISELVNDMHVHISQLWLSADDYGNFDAVFIADGILCKATVGELSAVLFFDGKTYTEYGGVSPAYALKMYLITLTE